MAEKKIRAIICPVGKKPYLMDIADDLSVYQSLVRGYIQIVSLYDTAYDNTKYLVVCNEEGLVQNLPLNCRICGFPFFGRILVVKENGEEFDSVEPDFLDRFMKNYWKKGEKDT